MAKKTIPIAAAAALTAVAKIDMVPEITGSLGRALTGIFEAEHDMLDECATDETKVAARAASDKAKADFRKAVADLTAFALGGVLSGDERPFEAAHAISHNGVDYAPGDSILVNHKAFTDLKEVGAIEGEWPD